MRRSASRPLTSTSCSSSPIWVVHAGYRHAVFVATISEASRARSDWGLSTAATPELDVYRNDFVDFANFFANDLDHRRTNEMLHRRFKTREVFDLASDAYVALCRAAHRAGAADAAPDSSDDDDDDDAGAPPPPQPPRQRPPAPAPRAAPPGGDAVGAGYGTTPPAASERRNRRYAGADAAAPLPQPPPPNDVTATHSTERTRANRNTPRTAKPALGCVSHLLVQWPDRQRAGGHAANLVAAPIKAAALAATDRNVRPPALSSGLPAIDGVFHEVCAGNGTLSHCVAHHGLAAGTLSETDGPKAAALPLAFPAPARVVGDAMTHDWSRDPALAVGGGTPCQPVAPSGHGLALERPPRSRDRPRPRACRRSVRRVLRRYGEPRRRAHRRRRRRARRDRRRLRLARLCARRRHVPLPDLRRWRAPPEAGCAALRAHAHGSAAERVPPASANALAVARHRRHHAPARAASRARVPARHGHAPQPADGPRRRRRHRRRPEDRRRAHAALRRLARDAPRRNSAIRRRSLRRRRLALPLPRRAPEGAPPRSDSAQRRVSSISINSITCSTREARRPRSPR